MVSVNGPVRHLLLCYIIAGVQKLAGGQVYNCHSLKLWRNECNAFRMPNSQSKELALMCIESSMNGPWSCLGTESNSTQQHFKLMKSFSHSNSPVHFQTCIIMMCGIGQNQTGKKKVFVTESSIWNIFLYPGNDCNSDSAAWQCT